MTAVPAQAAGVKEMAIVAPPTQFGAYNADLLATCQELGITEVYRVGGAQAVAALAYGVEGIPQGRQDRRPGQPVCGAGQEVRLRRGRYRFDRRPERGRRDRRRFDAGRFHGRRLDCAGGARTWFGRPDYVERAPAGSALPTNCSGKWPSLSRGDLARQSLEEFGALILVRDADEACAMADEIASEHLHIATDNAEALLEKIPHAGAVFLGHYSPVALGDYAAGPSHVLAHRRHRAVRQRAFGGRFCSLQQRDCVQPRSAGRRRRRHSHAGRQGRANGASGECRHPASIVVH